MRETTQNHSAFFSKSPDLTSLKTKIAEFVLSKTENTDLANALAEELSLQLYQSVLNKHLTLLKTQKIELEPSFKLDTLATESNLNRLLVGIPRFAGLGKIESCMQIREGVFYKIHIDPKSGETSLEFTEPETSFSSHKTRLP